MTLLLSLFFASQSFFPFGRESGFVSGPALGHVVYEQFTYAPCDKFLNGPASLWFNNYESVYVHDEALKKATASIEGGEFIYIPGDEEGFPVYLNLSTREIIFKAIIGLNPDPHIVHDTLGRIDWQIFDEYKTLGGHPCQKAAGEFAGRLYEAWFATDIPIPFGPYKLWGLPGLILEAKSDNEDVQFLFKRLELSNSLEGEVFVPSKGRGHFYSYEEYQDARAQKLKEIVQEARAEGDYGFTVKDAPWDCSIEIRQ